jgi:putative ABC transport system permease protein
LSFAFEERQFLTLISLLKNAAIGLKSNRLRALLTTLGVVIGVGTLIAMVSIIEGMNRYTYEVLGSMGSNTVYIQKFKWEVSVGRGRSRGEWREIARRKDLIVEDASALLQLESVEAAAPVQPGPRGLNAEYLSNSVEVGDFEGSTPSYLGISGYEIAEGRNLSDNDVMFRRQVCILGEYIVENLFDDPSEALGSEISIGTNKFIVVGLLEKRGQILGNNLDDIVVAPVSTIRKIFPSSGRGLFSQVFGSLYILTKIRADYPLDEGMAEIEELLRTRRGRRFDQDSDFALNTQDILVEAYEKLTGGIFLAMIGIASLALLVGGIGIMNIMLVSVTERTREIGIRMAVGAKRRDILMQFLFEAVLLTAAGGILGVIVGLLIGKLVDVLTPLTSVTPAWAFIVGLGFSAIVGLFFGMYPASKASRLDPIEALRYQ